VLPDTEAMKQSMKEAEMKGDTEEFKFYLKSLGMDSDFID
jgi:hypothetical protein